MVMFRFLRILGRASALSILVCAGIGARAGEVQIVVDKELSPVAQNALAELQRALAAHGSVARVVGQPSPDGKARAILVGIAGESPAADRVSKAEKAEPWNNAESLVVHRFGPHKQSVLVCGRNDRGLSYALRDVARSIELTAREEDPLAHVIEENAGPRLTVRNVSIHPMNADVERRWYFDERFWQTYFRMLALHRFNQFTLTFSDQTNYMCPVYAFMLDMPEYPTVRVEEHVKQERAKQLAMLKRIAELAEAHGIDFNLAIWMQAPVPKYSGAVEVTGLPEGDALSGYCALGLRRLLEACPAIRGVQLRMNEEAGVAADKQAAFFQPIFEAIRAAGRPIRLDLRFKGLQPATTQAAIDEKLDVTVSTKFWAEHFGLPFHPTIVDSHWRQDRYSFGSLLRKNHAYRVTYQLWNVGSQRLTLWGDPDYARRFAESCDTGDADGFEIFAPLTNQGYGNRRGEWRAIADPAYRVGEWDQERYWFFYLCFGRFGFQPTGMNVEVWQREFRSRFGAAAPAVEKAYAAASEVLPMITAARLPGASEWSWWPEMDTGGNLQEYMSIQPSDPGQFYGIRRWRRTPGWRWEEWDTTPGFVEDAFARELTGKWTPWMTADHLDQIAQRIDKAWAEVGDAKGTTPERRMTEVDHRLLAELARYHAAKMRAATELAFFEADQQGGRIELAEKHATSALEAWKRLVGVTTPVYARDLVFGIAKDSPRSKLGSHHTGRWEDRLPEVEADVTYLRDLRTTLEGAGNTKPVRRLFDERNEPVPLSRPKNTGARRNQDGSMQVTFTADPGSDIERVLLHHRPFDQTRDWTVIEMHSTGPDKYEVIIPPDQIDRAFDWQSFIEVLGKRSGARYPSWKRPQAVGGTSFPGIQRSALGCLGSTN